jgi:negative regulator of flagellin synthesis FlgM
MALDETHLSSTASLVGQALSGSDVRADKVSGLQQSIASGTYSVPSSDVAAKVLSTLLN